MSGPYSTRRLEYRVMAPRLKDNEDIANKDEESLQRRTAWTYLHFISARMGMMENMTSFDSDDPKRIVHTIVAKVPRSDAHEAAEAALATVKQRIAAIAAEIRQLTGLASIPGGNPDAEEQVRDLSREQDELREQMAALRRELSQHRVSYALELRAALLPTIIRSAASAGDSLRSAQEGLQVLEAAGAVVQCAGGDAVIFPQFTSINDLIQRLDTVAGWQ
jgi:hypothetical protein